MISRSNQESFFSKNWHFVSLAAAFAFFAAAAVFFFSATGVDPDEEASLAVSGVDTVARRSDTGVEKKDMTAMSRALSIFERPVKLDSVDSSKSSFLVSAPRIHCPSCQEPIPEGAEKCMFCGYEKPKEVVVELDSDNDTMPDSYEKKYGLNPAADDREEDKDGDGFTNYEEFVAATDPSDRKSHREYTESLELELPLSEVKLSFYFEKVQPLPGGKFRHYFRDFSKKDAYGNKGATYRPLLGEEIGKSGFIIKTYTPKKREEVIKGSNGLKREINVSEVVIERQSDRKAVTLVIGERGKSIDIRAKLKYVRNTTVKDFTVVPGSVIDLHGEKYKVKAIEKLKNGASVVLESILTGKEYPLKRLES